MDISQYFHCKRSVLLVQMLELEAKHCEDFEEKALEVKKLSYPLKYVVLFLVMSHVIMSDI